MSIDNLIQVIYEESGYPSDFCIGSDNKRLIEAIKDAHKPITREQQLTLMSAGIKQFIDQIKFIDDCSLSQMSAHELKNLIVSVGEDSISSMNPLDYTVNMNDVVTAND